MTLSKAPIRLVKDLIENNWDEENITNEIVPLFTAQQGEFEDPVRHMIVFDSVNEVTLDQGTTGYISMNQGDSAPTQIFVSTLQAECSSRRFKDNEGPNPMQVSFDMSKEVKRIVRNNFDSESEINYFTFINRERTINIDFDPPLYKYICEIRYSYIEQS